MNNIGNDEEKEQKEEENESQLAFINAYYMPMPMLLFYRYNLIQSTIIIPILWMRALVTCKVKWSQDSNPCLSDSEVHSLNHHMILAYLLRISYIFQYAQHCAIPLRESSEQRTHDHYPFESSIFVRITHMKSRYFCFKTLIVA